MKVNRILFLCSAIALPQLALAGLSDTNPAGLGIVHALLNYCSQVDPRDGASFKAQWSSVQGDAPEKQLDSVEGGGAYKQGYDSTIDLLSKLPKAELSSICVASARAWSGTATASPTHGVTKHVGDDNASGPHKVIRK